MMKFTEFSSSISDLYNNYCVNEWFSAFMHAFDSMCHAMQDKAKKGQCVDPVKCCVCLKLVFNQDKENNIKYNNNNNNMFIFPTSTLPKISEQVLSIIKIKIAEKLALYGWQHLLVHSSINFQSISIWTESSNSE